MMLRVVIEIKQVSRRLLVLMDLLVEGLEVHKGFLCLVKLQLGGTLV